MLADQLREVLDRKLPEDLRPERSHGLRGLGGDRGPFQYFASIPVIVEPNMSAGLQVVANPLALSLCDTFDGLKSL